jgi:hypothetical protein
MKFVIIFNLVLFFQFSALSEDSTTTAPTNPNTAGITDESALNQKLLENGAASHKILDEANKTGQPTSIKIFGNKGSSTTTSKNDLTDQDKQLSENYVDQAGANRILQEKCKGDMTQVCAGNEVDHKTMGMNSGMVKAAAAAYASFGAMGDILPLSKPDKAPAPGTDAGTKTDAAAASDSKSGGSTKSDSKKEKASDYCKYIPVATEAVAAYSQKATVQDLNNGGETSQKEALLKAAKSHEGRAKQAQIQSIGWYGGGACYAAGALTGQYAINTSLAVKVGAAALLGTFYQGEVAANNEYAKKTRDIANSLPGKGDCNPVTENECYCAEPEHEYDSTYCQAQIEKKKGIVSAFKRVACTDDKLQLDPSCNCNKTNTCFDKVLENRGSGNLELGFGTTNSPFKAVASLAQGKLEGGIVNSQASVGTAAIAKKALNDFASKLPVNNSPLSSAQKLIADSIASRGIPSNIARLMAQNASSSAMDKAMSKMSGMGPYGDLAYAPTRSNNVLDFSGGGGLGVGGKKEKAGGEDFLGKMNLKGGATANSAKLLEFAQKAQSQAAQIAKPERALFDIISLRYQMTGRKLLQIDSNN